MPELLSARAQMSVSLIFHIVFSVLGVGLPLLLCISEGLALRHHDATWMRLTRQWTKAFGILFAVGAVSGAIVEFEIALLWPTFATQIGAIAGLPFAMEGFAFFLEGIFLGIYLYGWDRLSPRVHWLCSFPIWLSGALSAWFIVSANSWMNSPVGFRIVNGKVVNINPFEAILNPATPYETTHMILASYVATGFAVAAVYAVALLRGHHTDYNRKALLLGLAMGAVAIPLQIFSGDLSARFLETSQPAKYAAMEGLFQTQRGAPLYIGGIADPQTGKVYFALQIPHGESLITHFDLNALSHGLNEIPVQNRPNPLIVHAAFDMMVASGFFILLVGALFWFLYLRRRHEVPTRKWLLWGIVLAGPLAMLAVESGWMVTEEGRQPWVIYGLLRVKDAVTPSHFMNVSFLVFSVIYVVLGTTLVSLLVRLGRTPEPERQWADYMVRERPSQEG